jgi:hypothetical protein
MEKNLVKNEEINYMDKLRLEEGGAQAEQKKAIVEGLT